MADVKKWMSKVIIAPRKTLLLAKEIDSPLHIINNNAVRMAFKLKTNRSGVLKPNVTCGFAAAHGGCVSVKLLYKPGDEDKGLHENDRLTIILQPAEATKPWEACLIETKDQPCGRMVLKLKEAASPDAIGVSEDADEQ